ncbi:MAG: hypothetical protein HY731_01505, partial [Candidatus Tectomicrobia bacterium]|nr:hypothetical protein [Candidatus Tectomicrobia bacterium]
LPYRAALWPVDPSLSPSLRRQAPSDQAWGNGWGAYQSHRILMVAFPISEEAKERLQVMVESNDGFYIAERDLELRGPGEFLGTKQSGLSELKFANLLRDQPILEEARVEAFEVAGGDPDLSRPEHQLIRQALEKKWKKKLDLLRVE